MFVYLSKKIAIPNNVRLNCLAWNCEHGYIALGGDDGLVKVLKLDQATGAHPTPLANAAATAAAVPGAAGIAAPSNLTMNQSLEGHKAAVQVVTWNESMQKLTTSDQDGVIIVWMMYKGNWYEEMTNDRKKSTVKGMSWTADGQKICIVYEDGAIIVGSADGNRIWGKELKNTVLTGVQWSPDGRLLLFSLRTGEVHLYDNQGVFVMKLNVQCVALSAKLHLSVVGLHWHHGGSAHRPVLVICYENGMLQIMRHENDDLPVIVDTGMLAVQCLWNHVGSVLAVCGTKSVQNKETNNVMFYSVCGTHLRTLKIPGREISAMSWEGNSLRCAMTVDSYIYFANIRPDYMWCFFNKTVVYVHGTGSAAAGQPVTITFWDTASNQSYAKLVETTLGMAASQDFCVIAVELPHLLEAKASADKCQLLMCNSISTTVDSIHINIRPLYVTMNSQYVVVASRDHFILWHYNTPKSYTTQSQSAATSATGARSAHTFQYHIDDIPSAALEILNDLADRSPISAHRSPTSSTPTSDPISCIALSDKLLLIARESGLVLEYAMPQIALRHRHRLEQRAYKMSINSNSTRAAIIDTAGVLTTIDLVDSSAAASDALLGGAGGGMMGGASIVGSNGGASGGRIERKDVWAMCWARDNPQLLALMEKTRMYVIRGTDPEEPIACSGYICAFEDLEITGVLLDDLASGAAQPDRHKHVLQLRVKSLRDTEELLAHVGIAEAKQFIEDNSHPRLWRLFARAALKQLDLDAAEAAFVRCTNYAGIQLVKRLRSMSAAAGAAPLQRAEVAAFFGDYDEAEKLYLDADRRDLAVELRRTLCDWFRTVQLTRMGAGAGMPDQHMEQVWLEIANDFAAQRAWPAAREYYAKAHDVAGQMQALYQLERYEELAECVPRLPERSPLLAQLGRMLSGVGMCDDAVAAYLRLGDARAAVDTCVSLKQWGQAVALAQQYRMPQIAQLLDQHAGQLLLEGRLQEAIALQRKAGRFLDAARLMTKLAEGELAKGGGGSTTTTEKTTTTTTMGGGRNYLRIKKIYVMAGLLTEEHLRAERLASGGTRMAALAALPPDDAVLVERIWTAAQAYHFWLLVQRQLRGGLMHSAVLTALRLREYEEILCVESVFCMLALASCADRAFGACSRAFIKLESLDGVPETRRLAYEELAVGIFAQHEPADARTERVHCFTCEALVANWCAACTQCGCRFPACVASGQPLMVPTEAWQCGVCHHCAHAGEMVGRVACPLCHSAVVAVADGN